MTEAQKRAVAKYESTKAKITIRVTPEEKKQICIKAAQMGKSVTAWLRELAIKS